MPDGERKKAPMFVSIEGKSTANDLHVFAGDVELTHITRLDMSVVPGERLRATVEMEVLVDDIILDKVEVKAMKRIDPRGK